MILVVTAILVAQQVQGLPTSRCEQNLEKAFRLTTTKIVPRNSDFKRMFARVRQQIYLITQADQFSRSSAQLILANSKRNIYSTSLKTETGKTVKIAFDRSGQVLGYIRVETAIKHICIDESTLQELLSNEL